MSRRVGLARRLLRMGAFARSLAVVVMRPDDLVEFSRQNYDNPEHVEGWGGDKVVDSGLWAEELDLLAKVPTAKGNLLLLGLGGGREAIPLARMGFRVTGVDYLATMVERAQENAAQRGLQIEGLVQEISQLEVPASAYDVVFLSRSMYSCVPTRARRVEMIRRIARALKPGGFLLCQFRWRPGPPPSRRSELLRRAVAVCSLGNLAYEEGDTLWGHEFVHLFASEDVVREELEEGGLTVVRIHGDTNTLKCAAVCRKGLETGHDSMS